MNKGFSIVIPTYNRSKLLERCITSIQNQCYNPDDIEIIVVDNNSSDNTNEIVNKYKDKVRYIKLEFNNGPGPARNEGLINAKNNWIIMVDDDDELLPDAIDTINNRLNEIDELSKYPVYNFATTNSILPEEFKILCFHDYITNEGIGDFIPVFNKLKASEKNLKYPEIKIGGESLLWLRIALDFQIPSWSNIVCKVNNDAPSRLTHVQNQIKYAGYHAYLQQEYIKQFGTELSRDYPMIFNSRVFASGVYSLLDGKRISAIKCFLKGIGNRSKIHVNFIFICMALLPLKIVHALFKIYRRI